uniref:Amine oxidase n=1 Tax=Ananas comosus var. bracteatus TaxID=296719 RepID=A0A6V7NGY8_ANACO|nr:unnamed protein product [Ananas comosus var. bracteatus]
MNDDGKFEAEVKLTEILSLGALLLGESRKYGTTIAPGLYALVHQHFFVARMDMAVDCKPTETFNQVVEKSFSDLSWKQCGIAILHLHVTGLYLAELFAERHKLAPFVQILPFCHRLLNQEQLELRKLKWKARVSTMRVKKGKGKEIVCEQLALKKGKGKEIVGERPVLKGSLTKVVDPADCGYLAKETPLDGNGARKATSCRRNADVGVDVANVACSSSKRVTWADNVGSALTRTAYFSRTTSHFKPGSLTPYQPRAEDKPWTEASHRKDIHSNPHFKKTYREALLTPASTPLSHSHIHPKSSGFGNFSFKGRCFRCLGRDHRASHCRDPIRCTKCFKSGHFAKSCMHRLPLHVYRFMRARPAYLSAFVPLSDDFAARQNRRRNAILVDVIPPANLGHFPQDTIANGLASRFGGYPNDFQVARYSERDYVVFLPEWVQSDRLISRDVLSLGDFRLRCFPWNPYRGARRPPLTYKAWIRLVSLPYECWSSRTVAALVGGFS